MTPRRSSRARTTQPSPALVQQFSSTSTSSLPNRDRSTRSNNQKIASPRRSQSVEDADAASRTDRPHTRRRTRDDDAQDQDQEQDLELARGKMSLADDENDDDDDNDNDDDNDDNKNDNDNDNDDDDEDDDDDDDVEEEEVTRCLCGQQDYPGLPPSRRDALSRKGLLALNGEDGAAIAKSADSSELLSDEIGSMFIQCDSCKVWQHGGCVGIMDEAMSPEEYFCEKCQKNLHRITSESNGQFSSQYLPVAPLASAVPSARAAQADSASPPAASSRESSRDNARSTRDSRSRQNDAAVNPKRRSTMNSREAAYDEEEQLRRAIQESKEDTKADGDDLRSRRAKRSRSDSEAKQGAKRQRTSSPSPTATTKLSNAVSEPASEDESKVKPSAAAAKKHKGALRSQREKDARDTEEAESERADGGSRRKPRPDRRRGDAESDHESGSPTKSTVRGESKPRQTSPGTPAASQEPTPTRPVTRKSGRPGTRRGARGRNQYTRDRELNGNGSWAATGNDPNSPHRGHSHDNTSGRGESPRSSAAANGPQGNHHHHHHHPNSTANANGGGPELGKPSRPRQMNAQRTTMNEMKKRVAAILDFISRMQVEMATTAAAAATSSTGDDKASSGLVLQSAVAERLEQGGGGIVLVQGAAEEAAKDRDSNDHRLVDSKSSDVELFKELNSVEMMDVLTRHLLKWQQEYGNFGEKP